MSEIRIIPPEDVDKFFDIMLDAYPGIHAGTEEDKQRLKPKYLRRHDDPRITLWGLYRDGELLGGLRLFDYSMNVHGVKMPVGGGGSLAVSLLHKREHVAKELMGFFHDHYRNKGAPLTILWAFRPDFYRSMGYGLGTRLHVYEVRPDDFPRGESKAHVRFLSRDDLPAINDCYNRFVDRNHGMIEETMIGREIGFELSEKLRYVGFVEDGRVRGYLTFRFVKTKDDSFVSNDMDLFLAIYESPEVLSELLTFLHSQFDQINRVRVRTFDDNLHYLLKDPRNSTRDLVPPVYHPTNETATGIMFRLVDARRFFELWQERSFGELTCRLKVTVRDSFMPVNDGSLALDFKNGKLRLMPDNAAFDAELSMDTAEFSSLVMGAVDLKSLHRYGLARLSNATYLDTLDRLFASPRPICTTSF